MWVVFYFFLLVLQTDNAFSRCVPTRWVCPGCSGRAVTELCVQLLGATELRQGWLTAPGLCGCLLPALACRAPKPPAPTLAVVWVGFFHTGSSSVLTWITQGGELRKNPFTGGTGRCPEREYLLEGKVRDQSSQWKQQRAPKAGVRGGGEQLGWAHEACESFGWFCLGLGENSQACKPLCVK